MIDETNERKAFTYENIQTLEAWLTYVKQYESTIYVREKVGETFEPVALSALSPERWAHHIANFLEHGIIPVRVKSDAELGEEV